MKLIRTTYTIVLVMLSLLLVQSCRSKQSKAALNEWYLQGPVFSARPDSGSDKLAVKDPSIVFYQGNYHLFYTVKSESEKVSGTYLTGCAYASAPGIQELNRAERFSIDSLAGLAVIAPQIFYFEPRECWYLIAHSPASEGDLSWLKPVYMTNPDIENVKGWSQAKELKTVWRDEEFRIDFWVICDDRLAFLFFSDQQGSIYQVHCPLEEFPSGFAKSEPAVAISENHWNEEGAWKAFEAVHIYYVKDEGKYLALLEGAYPHPDRKNDVDARNRFIFGMTADSLNGKWSRIEKNTKEFLAEAKNIIHPEGSDHKYTLVSHPELIRAGYTQKLEIRDYKLDMIFQSFDGTSIPASYNYNELPWELVHMRNYK